MSFSDSYKKRLSQYGQSNSEAFVNGTKDIVNATFSDSPNYRISTIEGQEVGVRILEGETFRDANILFKPDSSFDIGQLVLIDGFYWMIFDFKGLTISPKASVQLCNESLRWKHESGAILDYVVVATATRNTKFDIFKDKLDIGLLQGGIYVYVKLDPYTRKIRPSQRFIIQGSVYEVAGVDDVTYIQPNGKGLLQLSLKLTTGNASDDWIESVADNSDLYIKDNGNNEIGDGDLW